MSIEMQNTVISLGLPILATIPIVACLCRFRLARKKRVSYGTVACGAAIVPVSYALLLTCVEPEGWWSHAHKTSPEAIVGGLVILWIFCILPAFFTVAYYQRRCKRDEKPVA